jgi:hypothetical protein
MASEMSPRRETKIAYCSLNNTAQTFLTDTKEDVTGSSSPACIDSNTDATIGRIFEASRHRQGGCEFSMDLGFGRAGTDRTPSHQIRGVLWRDRVQELAPGGKAEFSDIQDFIRSESIKTCELKEVCIGLTQSASDAEPSVYLETVVELGVIDEPFPADCGARFFKVNTHDDEEIVAGFVSIGLQQLGIGDRGIDVVNGAGSMVRRR